jgi:DnaJ-class molecular chaperone
LVSSPPRKGIFSMGLPCQRCRGSGMVLDHPCRSCRGETTKMMTREIRVSHLDPMMGCWMAMK